MTVEDNVIAAAFARAGSLREARQIALETIEFCGLTKRKDMLAKSLTIADSKRLEITRAMATGPRLILLDETFAWLNPSEQDEAIQLIRKIKASGVTIIIVEHIMKVIMTITMKIMTTSPQVLQQ